GTGCTPNPERFGSHYADELLGGLSLTLPPGTPPLQLQRISVAAGGDLPTVHPGGVHDAGMQLRFDTPAGEAGDPFLPNLTEPFFRRVSVVGSSDHFIAARTATDTTGNSHIVRRIRGGGVSRTAANTVELAGVLPAELTAVATAMASGSPAFLDISIPGLERRPLTMQVTSVDAANRRLVLAADVDIPAGLSATTGYNLTYAGPNVAPFDDALVNNADSYLTATDLRVMKDLLVDNASIGYDVNIVRNQIKALFDANAFSFAGAQIESIAYNDPRTWDLGPVKFDSTSWGNYRVNMVPPARSTAAPPGLVNSIIQTLNEFKDGLVSVINDGVDQVEGIANEIPLVDTNLADIYEPDEIIEETVGQGLADILNSPVDDLTVEDILDALNSATDVRQDRYSNVTYRRDGSTYLFDIVIREEKPLTRALDLGPAGSELGATPSAATEIDLLAVFDLQFTLGVDLDQLGSPGDATFIDLHRMSITAEADVSSLDFGLALGFVEAGVDNGLVSLDASANLTLNNPDGDPLGRVTLGELQSYPLASLFDVSLHGSLDSEFPVSANFGSFDTANGPQPRILIADPELFDETPPEVTTENFDDLLDLDNLTPESFLGLLETLAVWLDDLTGSNVMNTPIPFTGATLGDAIAYKDAFVDAIVGALDNPRLKAFDLVPSNGKLSSDVAFDLTIDDTTTISISVLAADTAQNTSLDDLVNVVNAALITALASTPYAGDIIVSKDGDQLTIEATNDDVSSLLIQDGEPLGFAPDQQSKTPNFDSAQDILGRLAETVGADYDPTTKTITFDLDFSRSLPNQVLPLAFDEDLGPIAGIATSSTLSAQAQVSGQMTVGVVLEPVGASFSLTPSTPLSALNGGVGVKLKAGMS
ncbi:MAG: hypothetical protein KDA60_19855, partial [Planctomycetales bacterium]|nr:hypothetical protein [Planctomycetales bacterium]